MSFTQEGNEGAWQSPPQVENQPNTGSYSDLPGNKLWDVQDPFKYSPPKPEGDLWALLLDPLIKKDKAQCEAWKDEVHNLLIFAGLFSAVVTAFIVESYKNLQADPSDTIVALLSQIALQTSRAPNATAVKLEPADSFVPTQSSIRVNVFWFLSLVLSLATVVVGIVSLQWLREHQSYESDLSPQEKYALFNMRADGLKAWHVDKIFTSLPLLLQSALVLFLGGIVDFLHAIGYWAVTVPVMVAISFVLMFLIATTLLPCLQVIYLSTCIPFNARQTSKLIDPPSQCPYKSPQSQAIRRIFTFLHRTNTLHHLRKFFLTAKRLLKHILAGYPGRFKLGYGYNSTVTECLRMAFQTQWWTHFDVAWLSIRDAYMRRSFHRELYFLGPEDQEMLPIHDAVAGLLLQRDQKSTAHLAYHCFDKISLMSVPRFCYYQETYLHSLLTNALGLADDTSLSDFLCLPDSYSPPAPIYLSILRQQNLLLFIGGHTSPEGVPSYAAHKFELYIRLVKYFHEENKHRRAEIGDQKISWCLTIRQDFRYIVSRNVDPEAFIDIVWQLGNISLLTLQQLESNIRMYSAPAVFIQHYDLAQLMYWVAWVTMWVILPTDELETMRTNRCTPTNHQQIFASIMFYLEDQMTSNIRVLTISAGSPNSENWRSSSSCFFFYLAVLYCDGLKSLNPYYSQTLLTLVLKYKELTIDRGLSDPDIEAALRSCRLTVTDPALFSKKWWDKFTNRASLVVVAGNNRSGSD